MPVLVIRVALLVACAVAVVACKEVNPAYCGAHPDDPICPDINPRPSDAPPVSQACDDNTDCKITERAVCDTTSGDCVQCLEGMTNACQGTTPVCGAQHTCEACRTSADCPLSELCLPSGACAAETDVAYVDQAGQDNAVCTKAMPCTDPAKALSTLRPYIKFRGSVSGTLVITRNVTMFADPGAELKRRMDDAPIVTVSGTSVVEINDLKISDADDTPGILTTDMADLTLKRVTVTRHKGNGISCLGKSLVISGSTISENDLVGISCTTGKLTVSSSIVAKNKRGGIAVSGASFDLTNNFIVGNGTGGLSGSAVGGVSLQANVVTAGSRFEFNTVVDNKTTDASTAAGGVLCDAVLAASNNIIARNTWGNSTTQLNSNTLGRCTYPTSSILEAVTTLSFVSPDSDPPDYHLKVGSLAIGQATTSSSVTVDFDGDARPQGSASDQGADEFKATP